MRGVCAGFAVIVMVLVLLRSSSPLSQNVSVLLSANKQSFIAVFVSSGKSWEEVVKFSTESRLLVLSQNSFAKGDFTDAPKQGDVHRVRALVSSSPPPQKKTVSNAQETCPKNGHRTVRGNFGRAHECAFSSFPQSAAAR